MIEMYFEQVVLVENDKFFINVYGFNVNCLLNVFDNFYCIIGLFLGIVYDIFEGVVSYVLIKVIKFFVLEGFLVQRI